MISEEQLKHIISFYSKCLAVDVPPKNHVMKTKIVYVLTSDESDYFLEMSLMSVWTARYHNPDAHIVLVTDEFTMKSLANGRGGQFISLFSNVEVVDTSRYDTKGKRSRYLKTTLREIVEGDYLYIDCDTVICESLEEIDNIEGKMALARDAHLDKDDQSKFFLAENISKLGRNLPIKQYFNCGISYVKDCPETHEFFRIWFAEWEDAQKGDVWFDQPPFYRTVIKLNFPIEELDGIWNCMLWGCFLPYIHKAKIIHTSALRYSTYPYKTNNPETLQSIRDNGGLYEELKQVLLHPKEGVAFNKFDRVITIDNYLFKMAELDVVKQSYYIYNNSNCSLKALRVALKWILRIHAYSEWAKDKLRR